jgi:uncharacterized membrane protein
MAESESASAITGKRFGVGAVLSQSVSIFGNRIVIFVLLGLVTTSPLLLFGLLTLPTPSSVPNPMAAVRLLPYSVPLSFVLGLICQATILYGAVQVMRGQSFGFSQSMGVALRRFLPMLAVAIFVGLATLVGTALLIVPGIIVFCILYVAVPVCVIERPGIFECLGRSSTLTKGYRWQVFAILLLYFIASFVIRSILTAVVGRLAIDGHGYVLTILLFFWQGISSTFGAVLAAVVYHDLRVAKEGVDTEKIAAVFA